MKEFIEKIRLLLGKIDKGFQEASKHSKEENLWEEIDNIFMGRE